MRWNPFRGDGQISIKQEMTRQDEAAKEAEQKKLEKNRLPPGPESDELRFDYIEPKQVRWNGFDLEHYSLPDWFVDEDINSGFLGRGKQEQEDVHKLVRLAELVVYSITEKERRLFDLIIADKRCDLQKISKKMRISVDEAGQIKRGLIAKLENSLVLAKQDIEKRLRQKLKE